jgi:hypothetical protein
MSLRCAPTFVLPLGLLLIGCAPSDPAAAPGANEGSPTRVAGAGEVARAEPGTAGPAALGHVADSETSDRMGRNHVAQVTSGESPRTHLPEGSPPIGSALPLRGAAGGRANATAVAVGGSPAVAIAREQSPPLPLAVVAAAYPQAFTPGQMRVLVQLGESFLNETTPTSPNAVSAVVASPELTPAQRWKISANASDDRFKAMFGYQAFNAMQLERAREAYAESKAK